ncbi:MAG: serine/threonine protein kinase [Proteobacteria bacterium]|jgi:serine/threonine-protein kinase|nr:serine/threonine protein kinase [Pseudomonadota bacterium]
MAEVFQGVAESIEGFKKKVAIKRVLPHLVENKKFLAMFLDEARLSLRMTHANVVHVFDIGQAGGTFFIVMEFVDGTNLKRLMQWMRENGGRVPMPPAIPILVEICRGLAYAHELTDADGVNLGIVHRDVSPPNILLSRQGEVKLVDFGLAKATSQLEHTDPGVVKGKFAYLAPEAAWGRDVDHRADIFACGIMLYELIVGKRLFLGENDVKTVELVRRAEVPPLDELDAEKRPVLEGIVRKALAYEPADRYQSCSEMSEELANFLFSQRLKVTGFDLRKLVERFVAEDEKAQAREEHRPSTIDQLIQEELGRFASLDAKEPGSGIGTAGGGGAGGGGVPLNPYRFEGAIDGAADPGGGGAGPSGAPAGRAQGGAAWSERGSEDAPLSLAQMLEGEVRLGNDVSADDEHTGRRGFLIGLAIALGTAALVLGLLFVLGIVP